MNNTYPLIRIRYSNEHIMAGLFAVLLLYLLPVWIDKPGDIAAFLAVFSLSLLLDAVCGFIKYKRPVCSVSAAVTAGILQILTPGIPLWGRLIAIFAAIIIGKQLWGGTGKNFLNPAIFGYLVVCVIFSPGPVSIGMSPLLIPALILSVPFIMFRPFAAMGYFAGIIAAWLTGSLTQFMPLAAVSIFIGSIVLTDPVTIAPIRVIGLLGGFAAAFVPFYSAKPELFFALAVLIFNLVSYLAGEYFNKPHEKRNFRGITLKSPYGDVDLSSPAVDLTTGGEACDNVGSVSQNVDNINGTQKLTENDSPNLSPEMILERIKKNGVYGMGGGAFPTADKIHDVLVSGAEQKYLLVNAAECDPGLIHDKWILKNRLNEVFKGMELVSLCIGFDRRYFAVKGSLEIECPDDICLSRVQDNYPAGYEKSLIRNVLGINVSDGAVPSKLGILVVNVQTMLEVYEAVCGDKPAENKYITVSDLNNGTARTVLVKLGSRIYDTAERIYPGRQPVFTGGGIMQSHMSDDDELITKHTNFIAVSSLPRYKESPFCSNCGSCRSNCPKGLAVNRIAELADLGKYDEIKSYQPEKCIKCGLCSYVCLAGRNLSAKVADAKEKVLL